MIMDRLNTFCNNTALNTGGAGTYLIGDVIDLTDVRDIAQGNPVWLCLQVSTTATSGGSATAVFTLASDAQAAIATDGSATTHVVTTARAVATLTAGRKILVIALPLEGNVYERYLGILQTTAVAAFTAGAIDAFLTMDPSVWKAYADAVN